MGRVWRVGLGIFGASGLGSGESRSRILNLQQWITLWACRPTTPTVFRRTGEFLASAAEGQNAGFVLLGIRSSLAAASEFDVAIAGKLQANATAEHDRGDDG